MIPRKLVFILVLFFSDDIESKIMCKSENNSDLDWYIVIKYPSSYNFFYLSSATNGKSWELPNFGLDTDKNMVAVTLKQAYNSRKDGTFYAFYNDQVPKNVSGTNAGHLKGGLNFDSDTGYWLVHSVPHFPPKSNYNYPSPQHVNGQALICISVKSSNLNSIVQQLLLMYSKVYSFNLPPHFTNDTVLANGLSRLVNNLHSPGPKLGFINFTTSNKSPLMHFGKSNQFNDDIYSGYIAPALNSTLYVESWMNGNGGRLPSDCTRTYKVYNIKKVKIHGYEFDESTDHSKWAVTSDHNVGATCIGDINRMQTQMGRGGGSLCIFEKHVWTAFSAAVADYEKCQKYLK